MTGVWVLTRATAYEGETLHGAYSTRELAEQAAASVELGADDRTYIYEVPVDAPEGARYAGELSPTAAARLAR